jgi:hypothetical protein
MSKTMSLSDIGLTYDNRRTFANVESIYTQMAKTLGFNPLVADFDQLNAHVTDIEQYIVGKYTANSVRCKLSELSSLMSRMGYGKDHNIAKLIADKYPQATGKNPNNPPPIDWVSVALPYLNSIADNPCEKYVIRAICMFYRAGYVMRPAQMFDTSIDPNWKGDDKTNHINMGNGCVHIKTQKNAHKFQFYIDMALIDEIKTILPKGATFLLPKMTNPSERYGSTMRGFNKIGIKYSADEFRESYETWLANESGWDDEKIVQRRLILGHSKDTAEKWYVYKKTEPEPVPAPIKLTVKFKVKACQVPKEETRDDKIERGKNLFAAYKRRIAKTEPDLVSK